MPSRKPTPAVSLLLGSTLLLALVAAPAVADTVAQCNLQFDASWSEENHPTDFPPNPHFSGLIGGTHNDQVVFWAPGGLASPGIQQVAETGAKTLFQGEVEDAILAGSAAEVVSGGGIPLSPGTVSVAFEADLSHPYLTVVSMIAPSPDWFVGIHGLPLFEGGRWIEQQVVDLPPYDAGTDSGASYTSADVVTIPPVPIAQITGFPFDGPTSLGTFTVECQGALVFTDGFEDGTLDAWSASTP